MGKTTDISWTDATWNMARGCTKVNSDCRFCYMYRDSYKGTRYNPQQVVKTKMVFDLPLKLKEPSKIFTCSLTDFFHEGCDSFREEAWDVIRKCPQHTFQILTKRPERIIQCLPEDWGDGYAHVWLGISAGNQENYNKMLFSFANIKAKIKFLSAEPLHGSILLHGINDEWDFWNKVLDWVIIGGESGNETGSYRYRPCKLLWLTSLVGQCNVNNIPVFVKQLGTCIAKEDMLKDRHGRDMNEFPNNLQVRQFPENQK